jgi:ubiquinone biosynthesis protein
MSALKQLSRLATIQRVFFKYAIDELLLQLTGSRLLRSLCALWPTRYKYRETRDLPRGQRLRLALQELGPVFIKFGQMLSTRRDLLPDDISDQLALLQDSVAPFDSAMAKSIIENELGESVESLFTSFDPVPLAAASIAQVHSAELPGGASVVVKVLRPDIQKVIERDLALMHLLAKLVTWCWRDSVRMRPREVVREYEKTINDELDLQREAANAAQMKKNCEDTNDLYIPEVYWDYTREKVLVLERIHGVPISEVQTLKAKQVDIEKLAQRCVNIFFTQVFRDNFFHADMHPGNIFVSIEKPDDPHCIAVDFGIVGTLTEQDRHYLSQNMLAFFERDYRSVASLHIDSGWVPADTRVEEFESAIRTVCEPIFEKPLEEISFGQVLLRLFQTARRFNMEVQPQLVLLQKTLLNIEGLGRQLYPQLDIWATARPILKRWVVENTGPLSILREIRKNAPEWGRLLPQMPLLLHQATVNSAYRKTPAGYESQTLPVIYAIFASALFIGGILVMMLGANGGLPWKAGLLFLGAFYCLRKSLNR